jgi:hypothetical protein
MYRIDLPPIFSACQTIRTKIPPVRWLWFCLSLTLLPQLVFAHNGAIAYAYPVRNITVDGDLGDWQAAMTILPISHLEEGVPAVNSSDLTATFRVGYDPALKIIFIAVKVIDQSLVLESTDNVNWNTHDGAELYLDLNHKRSVSEITQYAEYGNERRIFGYKSDWDGVQLESQSNAGVRTYEWAITLDEDYELSHSIAFDVVVTDKDEDGSFSWLSWGDSSQKLMNPGNCGDLLLVEAGTSLARRDHDHVQKC